MAKAHAKRQGQTKTTQPTRTRSRGTASRGSSTPGRTRQALGERIGTAPAASRQLSVAEKPGILQPSADRGGRASAPAAATRHAAEDDPRG
jgi:hypothetical protein